MPTNGKFQPKRAVRKVFFSAAHGRPWCRNVLFIMPSFSEFRSPFLSCFSGCFSGHGRLREAAVNHDLQMTQFQVAKDSPVGTSHFRGKVSSLIFLSLFYWRVSFRSAKSSHPHPWKQKEKTM